MAPDAARPAAPGDAAPEGQEDHRPSPPRPDLRDEADEPDVVEQAMDGAIDLEDYPEG